MTYKKAILYELNEISHDFDHFFLVLYISFFVIF